jgi:hypothetical protein
VERDVLMALDADPGVEAVASQPMWLHWAGESGKARRHAPGRALTPTAGAIASAGVIGLLTGMRFLSLHGYADAQLAGLQRMLRLCGLLTLALNTAGALGHRQYGTALVDAVGPALLIGWSEAGPWLLRQIHAVCPPVARPEPAARQRQGLAPAPAVPVLPAGLLARARVLDAAHRAQTGRPISRDNLRSRLRIGRDRASALVAAVRAEATARAAPGPVGQAA